MWLLPFYNPHKTPSKHRAKDSCGAKFRKEMFSFGIHKDKSLLFNGRQLNLWCLYLCIILWTWHTFRFQNCEISGILKIKRCLSRSGGVFWTCLSCFWDEIQQSLGLYFHGIRPPIRSGRDTNPLVPPPNYCQPAGAHSAKPLLITLLQILQLNCFHNLIETIWDQFSYNFLIFHVMNYDSVAILHKKGSFKSETSKQIGGVYFLPVFVLSEAQPI